MTNDRISGSTILSAVAHSHIEPALAAHLGIEARDSTEDRT